MRKSIRGFVCLPFYFGRFLGCVFGREIVIYIYIYIVVWGSFRFPFGREIVKGFVFQKFSSPCFVTDDYNSMYSMTIFNIDRGVVNNVCCILLIVLVLFPHIYVFL